MDSRTLEFYNLNKNIKHSIGNLNNFLLSDIDKLRTINSLRESLLETIDDFIKNSQFDAIGLNWLNEIYCMIQTYKSVVSDDMKDDFQYFENFVFHGLYLNEKIYRHIKFNLIESDSILNSSRYAVLKVLNRCIVESDDSKLTADEINKLRSTSVKMSYLLLLFDMHPDLTPKGDFISNHRELEVDEFVYVVDRDDSKLGVVRHTNLNFDDNIAPSIKYKFGEFKPQKPSECEQKDLQHCIDYNNYHLKFWFKIFSMNHRFLKHKIEDDKRIISDYKTKRLGVVGGILGATLAVMIGFALSKF